MAFPTERFRAAGATDAELDVLAQLFAFHPEPDAYVAQVTGMGSGDLRGLLATWRAQGVFGEDPSDPPVAAGAAEATRAADPDPSGSERTTGPSGRTKRGKPSPED